MNATSVTTTHTTEDLPVSKRFFPGLRPIIGDEAYERVFARYGELYSNQELPANPQLRWHQVEGILPGLALYQVLRESGESQDNALGKDRSSVRSALLRRCQADEAARASSLRVAVLQGVPQVIHPQVPP